MKKSDLKNGAVVEIRDGSKYIKIDNTLVCFEIIDDKITTYCWLDLRLFKEDLTSVENKKFDIMKVNNDVEVLGNCYLAIYDAYNSKACYWTWVRKEKPKSILTPKEYEYLKAVIAPVKDRVNFIQKVEYHITQKQCIYIDLNDGCINLYYFEPNTQFIDMEVDKEYTLEELGLD